MPSVAGKRVLIIGDSLSASASAPGGLFGAQLRAHGAADVRVDARVSRSAVNLWNGTNGETGATIAADVAWKPDLVVVLLGTNDIATQVSATADEAGFRKIVASFPARTAWWSIGPPAFPGRADLDAGAPAVYATLRRVFGSSHVLDARPLTPAGGRTADGVHFTTAGAKPFAAALTERFLHTAGLGTALALVTVAVAGWFLLR